MLELRGVAAGYGATQVLRGVDLVVPAGLGGGAARAQRRREDHAAAGRLRPAAPDPRAASTSTATTSPRASPHALVAAGVCHVPEGRAIFRVADRAGEPRPRSSAATEREAVEPGRRRVSPARGAARARSPGP